MLLTKTFPWLSIHDAQAADVDASFGGQWSTSVEPEFWIPLHERQLREAGVLCKVFDHKQRIRVIGRRELNGHLGHDELEGPGD